MFSHTEYSVWAYRPEFEGRPHALAAKGVFRGLGQALNTAVIYAAQHPEHIVTVLEQQVVRGEFQPATLI